MLCGVLSELNSPILYGCVASFIVSLLTLVWVNMIWWIVVQGNTLTLFLKNACKVLSSEKQIRPYILALIIKEGNMSYICYCTFSLCVCFFFLVFWVHSTHWSCKNRSQWYCWVAHRERSWSQQRRRGRLNLWCEV